MERRLKRLPGEFYFFGLLPLLSRLPLHTAYGIAAILGRRLFRSETLTREIVCRNVERLRDQRNWPSTEAISQAVFENLFYEDLDTFYYRRWNSENIDTCFRFEGLQHLEKVAGSSGAILMTAHVGALCAALVALSIKGFQITHVSREYRENPEIPRAFQSFAIQKVGLMEEKMGYPLVNTDGSGQFHAHDSALEILRHLKSGHLVSMALDVNPDWLPGALNVPFLGHSGRFSPNIVRVAASAEVPLIPYFALRDPGHPHRHRILVRPPLELTGDPGQDLGLAVAEFGEILSRYPDQWFSWDSLTHFMPETE